MSKTKIDGIQLGSKQKSYSQVYTSIRKTAEGWPNWKKQTFNASFATSAHSKKVTQ